MSIHTMIVVLNGLLFYAIFPYILKPHFADRFRGYMKILYMSIIIILTLLDTEAICVGTVSFFKMRHSVLILAGVELIDAIENQIKNYRSLENE